MRHVQVRRLAESDLAAVIDVERRSYTPELQEPEHLIAERLRHEDESYGSLNLGLFADDSLVGYVLAHLDDGADYAGRGIADNIYVADLAVLPPYQRHLPQLLAALTREIRLEHPGLPIVAHAIDGTERKWRHHGAVLRRLGFELAGGDSVESASVAGAPALIVFHPLATADHGQRKRPAAAPPMRQRYRTSSGKELQTSVVVDEDGLRALAESWQDIERTVPGLTVFQTHRYQAAWVRSFALDRKLLVVCIHDGDELIGIAPFQVSLLPMHGKVLRQLSFLGAPWEVDRPRFLFRRHAEGCAEAAAHALLARREQWDVIWFHEQDAGNGALETFCTTLARRGVLHGRVPSSSCPYLTFTGSWEQLLATKSQKFRKNLKAARKKLQAAGQLEYTNCAGDEQRLQRLFGEYELLESRGWKARKGVGVSQSVPHLRFYRHLIHAFGDSGRFVFRCLRVDGQLVAATFGLLHERRFYSLHIAHDAAHAACSPGTYLESLEIEECFAAGLDEYDFLGGFLTNKVRWASHSRDTVEVHLYQRQPRLVAAYLYFFQIKPRLKRLLAGCGIRWPSTPRTDRIEEATS